MVPIFYLKCYLCASTGMFIVCDCTFKEGQRMCMSLYNFRPDGIGTVTVEEKERFEDIKERLSSLLENQISHFR